MASPGLAQPPPSGPITGTDGEERLRVSEVKVQLEDELQAMEVEIHREFLAELAEYLSQRRSGGEATPTDDGTELPAFYS
jgi:hypothetical protein